MLDRQLRSTDPIADVVTRNISAFCKKDNEQHPAKLSACIALYYRNTGRVDTATKYLDTGSVHNAAAYYADVAVACYLHRRRRLCFWCGLFVCLSVRRITRKLVNGF